MTKLEITYSKHQYPYDSNTYRYNDQKYYLTANIAVENVTKESLPSLIKQLELLKDQLY